MPNPNDIIKEDHEKVKQLFADYNSLTENDEEKKKEISHEILKSLTVHAKMEEKYFYPRLKENLSQEHPLPIDEAEQEHHAAKMLIRELKMMPVSSDNFDAKMAVLEESIMHHIEEEETELLPEAKAVLGADYEAIGKEMQDYKDGADKSLLEKLLGEE